MLQNIDYTNIKSIYYSFKISEILDLNIEFDIELTSSLVESLYSNEFTEYYQSTDFQVLNQEVFLWICDMAMNDEFEIECDYENLVYLGGVNTITMSFSNMIFTKHDQYFTVNFESVQFGTLPLEKQFDSTYQLSFLVPEDPDYYPGVTGILKIYHKNRLLGELDIYFETKYDFYKNGKVLDIDNYIYSEYNISYGFSSGNSPAPDTMIYAIFYENGSINNTVDFIREDFAEYSKFTLNYNNSEQYLYNITLFDDFHSDGYILNTSSSTDDLPIPPKDPDPVPDPDPGSEALDNWVTIILITLLIGSLVIGSLLVGATKGKKWMRKKNRSISSDDNIRSKIQEEKPIKFFRNDGNFNQSLFKNEESQLDFVSKKNLNDIYNRRHIKTQSSINDMSTTLNRLSMKILELTKSIKKFTKENKKLVFWTVAGVFLVILTLVGTYYYAATLVKFFMIGGIIIIIFGLLMIKNLKITGIGVLFVVYGFIIWVLKLNMMVLI